jgi:hypothetical protein
MKILEDSTALELAPIPLERRQEIVDSSHGLTSLGSLL